MNRNNSFNCNGTSLNSPKTALNKFEAASTSETSVNFYQTARRNNPGYSHLHTRRRENLRSHHLILNSICIYNVLFSRHKRAIAEVKLPNSCQVCEKMDSSFRHAIQAQIY
jgi:hypothetical protein